MTVVAWISHKGGTGRTVALANTAFQLARPSGGRRYGLAMACVDLDLASPTMGSVFGWPEYSDGAQEGVHDLLPVRGPTSRRDGDSVDRLLLNLWESPTIRQYMPAEQNRFALLPGKRGIGDVPLSNGDQVIQLAVALEKLKAEYDLVFLDVRSGLSNVGLELARPKGGLRHLVDHWVVMHRWTPQHLAGARELLRKLDDHGWKRDKVLVVESARMKPKDIGGSASRQSWVKIRDRELEKTRNEYLGPFTSVEASITVPDELILRWHECVVTPDMVKADMAAPDTYDAFAGIGSLLVDRS